MSSALAERPPETPAGEPSAQGFRFVSRFLIESSPLNPRKHFDEVKLQELARSIEAPGVGIIEPLVVRPNGERYELVAGERRWRAAAIAGLLQVPVIIKALTDDQALEIMVIENNQREDVNPLEEADGFNRLLNSGYDVHRLSDRLGRSTKYVYDRVKLLDLVPTAQQLLLEARLTAGHAIEIARLKPEHQERVIDPRDGGAFDTDGAASEEPHSGTLAEVFDEEGRGHDYARVKPRSVRELRSWIATHIRFDVAHAAQAVPLEFGEMADRVAAAAAKPGRGKKVIAITFDHYVHPDARDDSERTFGPASFKFADGQVHPADRWSGKEERFETCEHSILGVVAAGSQDYGRTFDVCIARDKCEVHWGREIREKAKNQKLRDSGQASAAAKREAAADARAAAEREARLRAEERWKKFAPALGKAVGVAAAPLKKVEGPLYAEVLKYHRLPPTTKPGDLPRALLQQVLDVKFRSGYSWHHDEPEMVAWAKLLGVDVKAIEKQVAPPVGASGRSKQKTSKAVQTSARRKKR